MNNISMDLNSVFQKIKFVERYQEICSRYNDFANSLMGNNELLYDKILNNLGYKSTYNRKEKFYRITSNVNQYNIGLQLTLKDGLVEASLDIKKEENYLPPDGRFDSIPNKMGVEFDRKKYNLPKYTNENDLQNILHDILLIYEDIKRELQER